MINKKKTGAASTTAALITSRSVLNRTNRTTATPALAWRAVKKIYATCLARVIGLLGGLDRD